MAACATDAGRFAEGGSTTGLRRGRTGALLAGAGAAGAITGGVDGAPMPGLPAFALAAALAGLGGGGGITTAATRPPPAGDDTLLLVAGAVTGPDATVGSSACACFFNSDSVEATAGSPTQATAATAAASTAGLPAGITLPYASNNAAAATAAGGLPLHRLRVRTRAHMSTAARCTAWLHCNVDT